MRLKKVLLKLFILLMIFIIVTLSILVFTKKGEEKNEYAILLGNPLDKQIRTIHKFTRKSIIIFNSYLFI